MKFTTHFRASIPDGSTRRYFAWGAPSNEMFVWAVLPIAAIPSARVSLDRVDVQRDQNTNTNTYWLTISNAGSGNMIFDGVYVRVPGTLA